MKNILKNILSDIEVSKSFQIIFRNDALLNNLTYFSQDKAFIKADIIEELSKIIYQNYYIDDKFSLLDSKDIEFEKSINKLVTNKIRFHKNWKIEYINSDSSIVAVKKHKRLLILPGSYITESNYEYPKINKNVVVIQHCLTISDNDEFAHIYGEEIDEEFYEGMIRIYFNCFESKISSIMQFFIQRLNKTKTPFHMKCIKSRAKMYRKDKLILFLDKRYFFDFKPILKEILKEIKPFLQPQTPLFTLKLHDGIGFAENPPNPNESFGMSRCRLIAEGIWQAHENKFPKSEWVNSVINYIETQGYDLEKFYLNPNSRFPYDFS